ncbi:MAG: nickel-dependent hydrogenase large subunit [Candidatus Omnitrophica bacterium]|nr:nickel-dependent hydrogenase large subunit [Candidatus Omnitrophota bacterium]
MSKKKIIPIGPYHPLQEEPEFFKLIVEGEKVVELEIEIGYNHRGIEKLAENKHWDQVTFVVERICGICSTSHPFAYVLAVEDLLGMQPPQRASYIRMIIDELQRIHSHLLWLGLAGHFIGYNTIWMWAWKAREPILDLFELISGNRQHYAMMKIGGVRKDIDPQNYQAIRKTIKELYPTLKMFEKVVKDDPVIMKRTKGVGVLTKEYAISFGALGPTARASGVNIDVRKDDPYALYDKIDWSVVVLTDGDIYAKILLRILECLESSSIILKCLESLDRIPKGEIETEVFDIPAGEGIGRVEAPRGECFHYVRSDGTNRPVRHKIRAPSFMNVATNLVTVCGYTISDAAITLAAVDPCYCCTERGAVFSKSGKKILTGEELIKLSIEKTEKLKRLYQKQNKFNFQNKNI